MRPNSKLGIYLFFKVELSHRLLYKVNFTPCLDSTARITHCPILDYK